MSDWFVFVRVEREDHIVPAQQPGRVTSVAVIPNMNNPLTGVRRTRSDGIHIEEHPRIGVRDACVSDTQRRQFHKLRLGGKGLHVFPEYINRNYLSQSCTTGQCSDAAAQW